MAQLFTNRARALIISPVLATDTTITIEAGKAVRFPVANTGNVTIASALDWFKAVITDASDNQEIIYVRTRSSGSGALTNVLRAQEGTTALAFSLPSTVRIMLTAQDIQNATNGTFAAVNTTLLTAQTVLAAAFSGPLNGNVSGNVSGSAGSAAAATSGYFTSVSATDPKIELHKLGVLAGMFHIPGSALLALAQTGGQGTASADRVTFNLNDGTVLAQGNVSTVSDMRLKKNWRGVCHGFLEKLAKITSGVYERLDTHITQAGVGAQDLQKVLPEAVAEDEQGMLSVAYGQAAMVSVVELARELMEQRKQIDSLKKKMARLRNKDA